MKKILTSSITDSAQLPILKRTIDHLQEQAIENTNSIAYADLGIDASATPIVLWGCVPTILTDTLTVTEGAIIYLGEVYQVSAQSIVKTGANVFTLSLDTTTFQAGEPTIYSDGATSVNTNQNLKIKLSQGLTGSGICDWDNRMFSKNDGYITAINSDIFSAISLPAGFSLAAIKVTYLKSGNYINIQGVIAISRSSGTLTDFYVTLKNRAYILDGDIVYPTEIYSPCVFQGPDGYTGYVTNQGNISFKDRLYFFPTDTLSMTGTTNVFFTLSYKTENLL